MNRNYKEVLAIKRQVADLLLEGYCNKEIANELNMPTRTVKKYLARWYDQYGIRDGIKRIKLAVALYYERNPEKRIPADYRLSNTERFILLNGGGGSECGA